jgi:hypothetical protein
VLSALLRSDQRDTDAWIGRMLGLNAAYYDGQKVRLTKACQTMVREIIWLAEEHPDEFTIRYDKVDNVANRSGLIDLPLSDHISRLRDDQSVYGSRETNIIPIDPGA